MKTNQLIEIPMGKFDVLQRTCDGYFDGNALLLQWNAVKRNPKKEIKKFIEISSKTGFLHALKEDLAQSQKCDIAQQPIIYIKGRNIKNVRTEDQVYMHPYLFIKFAVWINPNFEQQTIKFVYDELIKNSHLAVDNYNVITSALATMPYIDYNEIDRWIQLIVFKRTGKNMRHSATQEQLKEISKIEYLLALSINNGFIKNNIRLGKICRIIYNSKYPKPLGTWINIEDWLTPMEYSRHIGKSMSWVTKLMQNKRLPYIKYSGGRLIHKSGKMPEYIDNPLLIKDILWTSENYR